MFMPPKKGFLLRLSPELYEELGRWAEADFRSMNAQIEYILTLAVASQQSRRAGRSGVSADSASPDWDASGSLDLSVD